jgi:PAS domain S-box-containing protein
MNPADEAARLEAENRRLLSQLALATELAGVAIWRHDLAADRLFYSDEAFRVLQMTPRPEGLALADVRALIHPDDLPQVEASAREALASGGPTDMEARYRRADGQWRTVMTRRVLQRDAAGNPAAFIGVGLDVTERIAASRHAAELGRRFELAMRTAGIGFWSREGPHAHPVWSDEMRRIHGLRAGEPAPTAREWLERFVHPDDRERERAAIVSWMKGNENGAQQDLRIVRPDGDVRHVLTHGYIDRGEGEVTFGLVIDVTERRRAESALREAAERSALVARSIGFGTWEYDLDAGIAFWDEQMWRLRGLEPRPVPPSETERLQLVHPEDRARVQQVMSHSFDEGEPVTYEFRVVLPDGRVRWLASRSMPVRNDDGRTRRRIGVNWDVTDSRTADAVRQEREIARRESQAKSKFLARMSHELRTPLNGVLGFAQLLLAEDGGSDAAAQARRRRVEQIRAAGQHLLSLINDVLDLSSLEGGELRIVLQPVALAPLVAEVNGLVEPLLRRHRVTLATGSADVRVLADATRLRQVLLNLLSNAIKYNRPGGTVTLEAARHGSGVVVRVADNGRGMSDEQLRCLFEPFNRLGLENEGIEGTGIGLAIVKALVEGMGGSVHVDSQAGVGTLFELRLQDAGLRRSRRPRRRRVAAPCSTSRTTRSTRSSSRS